MQTSEGTQDVMPSLNDIISSGNQQGPNQVSYSHVNTTQTIKPTGQPNQTTQITRTVVTSQPAMTETTYYAKKVTTKTTTTTGPSSQINNRYNGGSTVNRNQTTTTSYTRPAPQTKTTTTTTTVQRSQYGQNNNPSSQVYRGNQRTANPPTKIGTSLSYAGNKNQPRRPQPSTSYRPKAKSPEPGSLKRKTINRGNPVENVQITHIIYTSEPVDFHITENLNMENLNTNPIQISKADRARLKKSGKITTKCSCDGVEIAQPKKINLKGYTTHYQHARGIGMTNDKKENINPMFYSSEIKKLKPINRGKDKEKLENIETFRSYGKQYNTVTSNSNTKYNPKSSTYRGGMNNTSTQKKSYVSGTSNNTYNRGGMGSSVKTTSTVYRGSNYGGGDGEIIKETNTKVQMGSRSQYNQTKPTTYTTSERKVYNQKSFFNK